MALPPKKRGRPKKILTDAEIEEATRAAMGAKPVIEITRVPRAGEDTSEDGLSTATAATSVIIGPGGGIGGTVTAVGGAGDIETGIANGMVGVQVGDVSGQGQETALGQLAAVVAEQAAVMPVTAKKSAPAPVSEMDMEAAKVQPTWVNETLASDDEASEQDKTGQASAGSLADGAFNPLAGAGEGEENPLAADTRVTMANPLGEEVGTAQVVGETEPVEQMQAEQQQQPMNEEDALLATATEQPPFVNECQEEERENVMEGRDLLEGDSDNPLAGIDGQDNEQVDVP